MPIKALENLIALILFFTVFPSFMYVLLNMDDWTKKTKKVIK